MMNNDGVVNGVDLAVGRMAIVDLAVVDDVVIEVEYEEIEKPLPSSYAGEGEKRVRNHLKNSFETLTPTFNDASKEGEVTFTGWLLPRGANWQPKCKVRKLI